VVPTTTYLAPMSTMLTSENALRLLFVLVGIHTTDCGAGGDVRLTSESALPQSLAGRCDLGDIAVPAVRPENALPAVSTLPLLPLLRHRGVDGLPAPPVFSLLPLLRQRTGALTLFPSLGLPFGLLGQATAPTQPGGELSELAELCHWGGSTGPDRPSRLETLLSKHLKLAMREAFAAASVAASQLKLGSLKTGRQRPRLLIGASAIAKDVTPATFAGAGAATTTVAALPAAAAAAAAAAKANTSTPAERPTNTCGSRAEAACAAVHARIPQSKSACATASAVIHSMKAVLAAYCPNTVSKGLPLDASLGSPLAALMSNTFGVLRHQGKKEQHLL